MKNRKNQTEAVEQSIQKVSKFNTYNIKITPDLTGDLQYNPRSQQESSEASGPRAAGKSLKMNLPTPALKFAGMLAVGLCSILGSTGAWAQGGESRNGPDLKGSSIPVSVDREVKGELLLDATLSCLLPEAKKVVEQVARRNVKFVNLKERSKELKDLYSYWVSNNYSWGDKFNTDTETYYPAYKRFYLKYQELTKRFDAPMRDYSRDPVMAFAHGRASPLEVSTWTSGNGHLFLYENEIGFIKNGHIASAKRNEKSESVYKFPYLDRIMDGIVFYFPGKSVIKLVTDEYVRTSSFGPAREAFLGFLFSSTKADFPELPEVERKFRTADFTLPGYLVEVKTRLQKKILEKNEFHDSESERTTENQKNVTSITSIYRPKKLGLAPFFRTNAPYFYSTSASHVLSDKETGFTFDSQSYYECLQNKFPN